MSLALFITYEVSTTVIDQVLEKTERVGSCASSFFVAEPGDIHPLERKVPREGTKTPIPSTWRSRFLNCAPQECSDVLKVLVPEPVTEEDDDDPMSRRFAILDERYVQSGELLACNREQDDSVTSLRMNPKDAAMYLQAWYDDQWEDHLKIQAQRDADREADQKLRASRRAALARHLANSQSQL